MKFFYKILIIPILFLPLKFAHAALDIMWSLDPVVQNGAVTAELTITGIEPSTPDLGVVVFATTEAGPDPDFDPYASCAFTQPDQNGQVYFTYPTDTFTYFTAVVVDALSYSGCFLPYNPSSPSQFQVYVVAQVRQINNGGNNNPPSNGGGNNPPGGGNNNPGGGNAADSNGNATTAGWPQEVFENPLNVTDLNSFVIGLLNALLKIGIPVMVIFLVYSGLRLVMARGNEKELESAKTNLLWVVVGVLILLSAWTIVKVLKGTFDELNLVYVQTIINFIS